MAIHKSLVSDLSWHPTMRAVEIEAGLELRQELSWDVGEERRDARGRQLNGLHDVTYAVFSLNESKECDLSEKLSEALWYLARRRSFVRGFRRSGGVLELFCGVFFERSGGFSIPPPVLKRAAMLGVALSFDVYEGRTAGSEE